MKRTLLQKNSNIEVQNSCDIDRIRNQHPEILCDYFIDAKVIQKEHVFDPIKLFAKLQILLICILFVVFCEKANAQGSSSEPEAIQFKDFRTELMWEAKVKIGNMINVGESKRGTRRVIPITGGTFSGPKIKGEVLPGGEDWQLVRPDGDTELYARYLLKTDDGHVIQIINRALMHMGMPSEGFYCRSVLDLEAPNNSPYNYLNHAIFIGTLEMPKLKPGEEPYVIIGVYKLL